MERPGQRRKRFVRSKVRVHLTPDDLAIIDHVRRHRFLRSTHLVRLLPHRRRKKLIERLAALYHAGYLDRPRAQLDYYARGGSAPMVYALGDRSPDVAPEAGKLDWSDKNREVKRPYIQHRLLVADILVAVEVAAWTREDLDFVDAERLLRLRPRPDHGHPWKLAADLQIGRKRHAVTLIPDAVFALRFRATGRSAYFFLEADRGTMPIARADLAQSSIKRKLLAYQASLKAGRDLERFGFDNLRVLIVATSSERVQSMIASLNDVTQGAPTGRFLFAEAIATTSRDPLAALWATNDATVRLDNSLGRGNAARRAG